MGVAIFQAGLRLARSSNNYGMALSKEGALLAEAKHELGAKDREVIINVFDHFHADYEIETMRFE